MSTLTTNNTIQGIKRNIAEAVHRAVCEFNGSDGCGRCLQYALAGWALACSLLKRKYLLQAGELYIIADPPEGAVGFIPEKNGFQRGEFHCWFVAPGENGKIAEFVDLSSRHYRRLVERGIQCSDVTEMEGASIATFGADRIQWTRKDSPPEFIWTNGTFPDVMQVKATVEATDYFNQQADTLFEQYASLVKLAWKHYAALTGHGVASPVQPTAKIGRNAPCRCGSGRKFKHCCLNKKTIPVVEKKRDTVSSTTLLDKMAHVFAVVCFACGAVKDFDPPPLMKMRDVRCHACGTTCVSVISDIETGIDANMIVVAPDGK